MKTEIAVAAGMLVLALSAPAAASPREYNRGYYDCSNGQFDEDAQSRAYRQGCRDAQREQGEQGGAGWGHNGDGPGYGGRDPDGARTATGRAMGARDPDGARTAADGTAASRGLRARRAFPTFRA